MNKIKTAGKRFGIILVGIILLALVVRTVLNIVFGVQLRNIVRQLKAQGRHVTIDQIRPVPVTESENAAVLLNQAFALMTIGERGKPYIPNQGLGKNNKVVSKIESVKSSSDISKWTPEEKVEIPKLVYSQDMQKIYNLLEEASRRPKCNFNLKYEEGPEMRLPHLSKMRSVGRLLAVKALIEAQSGNLNGALETLNIGLRVSNLLKNEPVLISKLVMNACDTVMIDCLQGVTKSKNISQDKANLIISELSKHTDTNFLSGEMALFGGWFLRKIDKELTDAVLTLALPPFCKPEPMSSLSLFIKPTINIFVRTGAWFWTPVFKKDLAVYFIIMPKLEDRMGEPYYKLVNEKMLPTKKWFKQVPKYCVFSRMILPGFERTFETKAQYQAYINVCRTGLALKVYKGKYGVYPDSLDKLKPEILPEIPLDPFTGENLIYRKTTNSVFIYSVGLNLKDDGGKWNFKDDGSEWIPQGGKWGCDIVWEE